MKKFFLVMFFISLSLNVFSQNSDYFNEQGWKYYNQAEYNKALAAFKNSLNKNQYNIDSQIGLAGVYLKRGAYQDAYNLFSRVTQLEPENTDALTGAGDALLGMTDFEKALEFYTSAIGLDRNKADAHYGIAKIYYLRGRDTWAERKLDTVFKINPYHYESLLLQAEIKSEVERFDEALVYIEKAISSKREFPDAYLAYGHILLKQYFISNNMDYIEDSVEEINRSLSIYPDYPEALMLRGKISYLTDDYEGALEYFSRIGSNGEITAELAYNTGLCFERLNQVEKALEWFEKSYNLNRNDDMVRSKLENFTVLKDINFGNPVRIDFSKEYLSNAGRQMKESLVDRGIYSLRKSIYMNPLNRDARDQFTEYMRILGYDKFYIDELKKTYALYPENNLRQQLDVAVIKRRNKLYFKEGYAFDEPVRDVPKIYVADFVAKNNFPYHMEGGSIIADTMTFGLNQFGRLKGTSVKDRRIVLENMNADLFNLNDFITMLADKYGEISSEIDYIVYGDYTDTAGSIDLNAYLMDFKTGVVISRFSSSGTGRSYLNDAVLAASRKIYNAIPFRGRVLKYNDAQIIINIGSFDGVKKDDLVYLSTSEKLKGSRYGLNRKIIFRITEADTLVSQAEAVNPEDMKLIKTDDPVFPLAKRRSVMVK
ncbi:MAG: tetratricopeptide repeat protein [Spirochaetes bacterium]|nr:tetratricopeptide repeat protein [Spirochaetota bacterium]